MEDEPASSLLAEYKKWSELNDCRFLLLKAGDADAQGRFFINLSIDENNHFTLYCPMDYSNTTRDRFFVEAVPSLWYWCNEINEYILGSKIDISLEDILNKAAALYDTEENPSYLSVDSEIKWDKIQTSNTNKIPLSPKPDSKCRAQNPKCKAQIPQPSEILTKEMFNISEVNAPGIHVDLINGEINKWAVFLSDFFDCGFLNSDLKWLKATYGYEFIELQVVFPLDEYPCYPPIVRIIRPRLLGISTVQISSLINCSTWKATCDLMSMLKSIKTSIADKGRVDKNSKTNNPQLYPEGVCTLMERDLISLAWLKDFPFKVYQVLMEQTTSVNMVTREIVPVPERATGCCNLFKKKLENISGWISRRMTDRTVALRDHDLEFTPPFNMEQDVEIERVIRNIYQEVSQYENRMCINSNNQSRSRLGLSYFSTALSRHGSVYSRICATEENLFRIVQDSQFMDFIVDKLADGNLFDICQHKHVYQAIIEILIGLKSYHKWSILLSNLPVITASVQRLQTESSKILSLFDWMPQVGGKAIMYPIQKRQTHRHVAADDVKWCSTFNVVCNQYLQDTCEAGIAEIIPHTLEPTLENKYKCALKGLQVITCDLQNYCARSQFFGRLGARQRNLRPSSVMRVLKEISSMATSLPLELGSSIFVCSGESDCMFMRALIVGPEGTPYSNGCFMFDVFFPDGYPRMPPKLHFCTTGDGTVDFSPNLYSKGDICLSLLGTWPGTGGELWYHTSTLLQVLVSIQGLVLVPKPYFNEPLNEHELGTEEGEQKSLEYNNKVYINTLMHAILPHLQRPDPCFKRILQAHFSIKKHKIMQEVEAQLILNPSEDLRKVAKMLKAYFSILQEEAAAAG